MRDLTALNAFRRHDLEKMYGEVGDGTCGMFSLPYPATGVSLKCVASSDLGWDHVSVSLPHRCPNWPEMEHAKRAFFEPHETAMQLHVPTKDHISLHPYCLHLWRPRNGAGIPLPPKEMVA